MRKYRRQWIERWADDMVRLQGRIVAALSEARLRSIQTTSYEDQRDALCECLALAREVSRGGVSIFTFDQSAYEAIEGSDAFGSEWEALEIFPYSTSFIETRGTDMVAGLGVLKSDLVNQVAKELGWDGDSPAPAGSYNRIVMVPKSLPFVSDHPRTLLDACTFDLVKYLAGLGLELNEDNARRGEERLTKTGANLIAFLSVPNMTDQIELTYEPHGDTRIGATNQKKSRKVSGQRHYEVGARLGAAIRMHEGKAKSLRKAASGTGTTPAPHPVRGHWSKRRHGPRDDWHYEPCYIHPYFTGADGVGRMDNVVRKVVP